MSFLARTFSSSLFQVPFTLALVGLTVYRKDYVALGWIVAGTTFLYMTVTAWFLSDAERREQSAIRGLLSDAMSGR